MNRNLVRKGIFLLLALDVILIALHAWHTLHFWNVSRYALEAYVHPFYKLLATFNLDAEGNAAVWYSSAKLLLAAVLCAAFWFRGKEIGRNAWGWILVGLIFLAMSLDETASLHEKAASVLMQVSSADALRQSVLGGDSLKDSFAWVIIFSPIILFVVLAFIGTFIKHLRRSKLALALTLFGVGLIVAAVGLEAGVYLSPSVEQWESSGFSELYPLMTSVEETCEVFGASLILIGLVLGYYTDEE